MDFLEKVGIYLNHFSSKLILAEDFDFCDDLLSSIEKNFLKDL